MIDQIIYDTHNPHRNCNRCVYRLLEQIKMPQEQIKLRATFLTALDVAVTLFVYAFRRELYAPFGMPAIAVTAVLFVGFLALIASLARVWYLALSQQEKRDDEEDGTPCEESKLAGAGPKRYLAKHVTEADAREIARQYNATHEPGFLSRKAESEEA